MSPAASWPCCAAVQDGQFSSGFSFPAGGNACPASLPFRQEQGHGSGALCWGQFLHCMQEGEVWGAGASLCQCRQTAPPRAAQHAEPAWGLRMSLAQELHLCCFLCSPSQKRVQGWLWQGIHTIIATVCPCSPSQQAARATSAQRLRQLPRALSPRWVTLLHSDQQQAENQIY